MIAELVERATALPRPLLVAMDVDGTLAPIVDDPARAAVPRGTAQSLDALSRVDGVVVAIVTGRDAGQLARMIALERVWRVVEHGGVILSPGQEEPGPIDARSGERLASFRAQATERWSARGARIEAKRGSMVVHVRELAARDAEEASAILAEARAAAQRAGLIPREGRHVVEAQLEPTDKGIALARLIERVGAASVLYAGDDRTDEPAIAAASQRGIGVFVRSAERPDVPVGASASLDGPSEVAQLLARLVDRLRE